MSENSFNDKIQTFINQKPSNDVRFIKADINAKVGEEMTQNIIGQSGLSLRNEAGENLVCFCVGLLLIARRWRRSVINCKTLPGAWCGTDLEVRIAEIKIKKSR